MEEPRFCIGLALMGGTAAEATEVSWTADLQSEVWGHR